MWIRSQDKEILIEANLVFIEEFNGNFEVKKWFGDTLILGTYSTKEKAIKVLDMIQELILYTYYGGNEPKKLFQMPQDHEVE